MTTASLSLATIALAQAPTAHENTAIPPVQVQRLAALADLYGAVA